MPTASHILRRLPTAAQQMNRGGLSAARLVSGKSGATVAFVMRLSRLIALGLLLAAPLCVGCGPAVDSAEALPDATWGRRGLSDGRLQKPRAMAIDTRDRVYIVDKTARIQAFTSSGEFWRGWRTPEHAQGCPTGLGVDREGNVLVADTHYYRVLAYSPRGEPLWTLGGTLGHGPGEFGLVTDVAEDSRGNLYVGEYGEYDRIQKFSSARVFERQWGSHGSSPGEFIRPQGMAIDKEDRIWVADSGNHRIQVFDGQGKLLFLWGQQGDEPGKLYYPYDLTLDGLGNVYVCEFGNSRVQKFTEQGRPLGCWGRHGRGAGQLHNPWAVVRDSGGKVLVLDTNNHRVQQIGL